MKPRGQRRGDTMVRNPLGTGGAANQPVLSSAFPLNGILARSNGDHMDRVQNNNGWRFWLAGIALITVFLPVVLICATLGAIVDKAEEENS
jgi:hypothetical protein